MSNLVNYLSSDAERKALFFKYKITHPLLEESYSATMDLIHSADCGKLGIGVGPTGVGKTTLMHAVVKKIVLEMTEELKTDRERIPCITTMAAPPENGVFSWKLFYHRALNAVEEIASNRKIPIFLLNGKPLYRQLSSGETVDGLRESLVEILHRRRPLVFFVDEAQHILKAGSGKKLQDQLDVLKTLADETRVPIVLLGTYPLLSQHALNGQLARRSSPIHMRRYRSNVPAEHRQFAQVVKTFSDNMPVKTAPDLIPHLPFLFERTLGCVGILKETLVRALNLAIKGNSATVTIEHLQKTALSPAKCEIILQEILEGERLFYDDEEIVNRIHSLLSRPPTGFTSFLQMRTPDLVQLHNANPIATSKAKKPKPGTRKPSRTKAGTKKS
ncbi:MAG: TniB family NTP-binding protein [Verrucomicrobiales bacterium]|jgi:hypothetical protein|nr:TniB family NTP-binding protein [Verrucomicrobiales bacterium]